MRFFSFRVCLILTVVFTLGACGGGGGGSSSSPAPTTPAPTPTPTPTPDPTPTPSTFTISGSIFVPGNVSVDSDVNEQSLTPIPNNTFNTAQPIQNPVILGGYANEAGAGPTGQLQQAGDEVDAFRVDLRAGQVINLFVASDDLVSDDLDLFLLDDTGDLIDASLDIDETESLSVPFNGSFVVQVRVFSGASNYVLSIGQRTSVNSTGWRLSDDFRLGDIRLKFNDVSNTKAQNQSSQLAAMTTLGLQSVGGSPERTMLFQMGQGNQISLLSADGLKFASPTLRQKYDTLLMAKRLHRRSDTEFASPNYLVRASRVPNDEFYRFQWHYPLINLPQAWDITVGSSNVIVAIVDSGMLLNHPDLSPQLIAGYDFVSDPAFALDGDGIDPDPSDPGDDTTGRSSFHGSHVGGTVAAASNNSEGVAGVSWNTRLMPLRVLGEGGAGDAFDLEQALLFAARLSNDSGTIPPQRADIINMSLGGPGNIPGFQSLMNLIRGEGIILVAAAGNESTDAPNFPSSLNGVISVSAVDINKTLTSYSNFGGTIDVAAPGGETPDINGDGVPDGVVSTLGDDTEDPLVFGYAPATGTSQATPHVSGVIALMKAVYPGLTPATMDTILASGAITEDLGASGRDNQFGFGLIDAQAAVRAAIEANGGNVPQPMPQLNVTPGALNFGVALSNLTLSVGNAGGGNMSITSFGSDASGFLSVTRGTVDNNGLGTYNISLDRGTLAEGTYDATITFTSTANTASIPVIWQVGDPDLSGDASRQFVLLIDLETGEAVQQDAVDVAQGVYNYQFEDVPAGNYRIVTGSDLDNDLTICDAGESCGAYLTLDSPAELEISSDVSDLDFDTTFNTNFIVSNTLSTQTQKRLEPLRQFGR